MSVAESDGQSNSCLQDNIKQHGLKSKRGKSCHILTVLFIY